MTHVGSGQRHPAAAVTSDSPRRVAGAVSAGMPGAGAIAGIVAGVAMAAFLVVAAAMQGLQALEPIERIGATFSSATTTPHGSIGRVLFGMLLHLSVSALVGLLFAAILPPDFPRGNAAIVCVGMTFAVLGLMASVVVPSVNPVLKHGFHGFGGSWVIAHALFGVVCAYTCQRLRRDAGGERRPRFRART